MLSLDFTSFFTNDLFCSSIPPGYHITLSCHAFVASSGLWEFLRLSLFLMTLTILKSSSQVLCRMSLSLGVRDLFFMITVVMILLKDHRSQLLFSTHCTKGTCYQNDFSLMMTTFKTWLRYVSLVSPFQSYYPFLPSLFFYAPIYGKKLLIKAHI